MYQYVDQSPGSLTRGGHFLLWAMRGWVISAEQHRCPCVALGRSFADLEMSDVLGDFHQLMVMLHCHGQQRMRFGALNLPRITEAEALMLALWSDVGAGDHDRMGKVMSFMLAETYAERAIVRMARVAARMNETGLISPDHPISCNHDTQAAKRGR